MTIINFGRAFLLLLFLPSMSVASSIGFNATTYTPTVGANFEIDIISKGVGLGGFDLSLTFDPRIIALNDCTFADNLGSGTDALINPTLTSNSADLDEISFLSVFDLSALQIANPFSLVHLEFSALTSGNANLSFTLGPGGISDVNGNLISPTLEQASIIAQSPVVSGVPEPSSLALTLFGAVGALWIIKIHLQGDKNFQCCNDRSGPIV